MNFGPFTLARWNKNFAAYIESGDDEDPETTLLFIAFGWAVRIHVWNWLCKPWKERWVECDWDAETVKRLGRSGFWVIHPRKFGFSLSAMDGDGFNFLQIFYGPNTMDSRTSKSWCKSLPWKMWRHVRFSLYDQDGNHFWTDQKAKWEEQFKFTELCPKAYFGFEDYDGEMIVATTHIQEREWRKGEGWFKFLSLFRRPKISRSLDLRFSAEVGTEKGSWKGGTTGHSIEMLPGELHEAAFRRYCSQTHSSRKGRDFKLRFIGRCKAPCQEPLPALDGE